MTELTGASGRDGLSPDDPLWAWALEAIGSRVQGMLEHVDRVREGSDIEGVHDMRVGSRRLVAAMRVFAHCFPDAEFKTLIREARRVTRALGAVRDMDVLLDYFAGLSPAGEPERLARSYLCSRLERQRERARKPLLVYLDELEDSSFGARLRRYLHRESELYRAHRDPESLAAPQDEGAADPEAEAEGAAVSAHASFRRAAPALLQARYQAFYDFTPYVNRPEAVAELHDMRIAAKWLRYTMELFAPAYADRLKPQLSVIKRFQELLGELHDADVRLDLLRSVESEPLRAGTLNRIGLITPDPVRQGLRELLQREEEVRARWYADFYDQWRKQVVKGFAAACRDRIAHPDGV